MKKNCKKILKKNLEQKKYLKEKVINYASNGKDMIIHLIVVLIKKISYVSKRHQLQGTYRNESMIS